MPNLPQLASEGVSATGFVTESGVSVRLSFEIPELADAQIDTARKNLLANYSAELQALAERQKMSVQEFQDSEIFKGVVIETARTSTILEKYGSQSQADWFNSTNAILIEIALVKNVSESEKNLFKQFTQSIAWRRVLGAFHELLKNAFDAKNASLGSQTGASEPLEITFTLEKVGENFIVSFQDNGTGFPKQIDGTPLEIGVAYDYAKIFKNEGGSSDKITGHFLGGMGLGVKQFLDAIKTPDEAGTDADLDECDENAQIRVINPPTGGAVIQVVSAKVVPIHNLSEKLKDSRGKDKSSVSRSTSSGSLGLLSPVSPLSPISPLSSSSSGSSKSKDSLMARRLAKQQAKSTPVASPVSASPAETDATGTSSLMTPGWTSSASTATMTTDSAELTSSGIEKPEQSPHSPGKK